MNCSLIGGLYFDFAELSFRQWSHGGVTTIINLIRDVSDQCCPSANLITPHLQHWELYYQEHPISFHTFSVNIVGGNTCILMNNLHSAIEASIIACVRVVCLMI